MALAQILDLERHDLVTGWRVLPITWAFVFSKRVIEQQPFSSMDIRLAGSPVPVQGISVRRETREWLTPPTLPRDSVPL